MSGFSVTVCTGQTEAGNYFLSLYFLKANDVVGCHSFLSTFSPLSESSQSQATDYFIMRRCCTCGKTRLIICLRENGCYFAEGSVMEKVYCRLCCLSVCVCLASVLQAGWRGCHMNLAAARQPCLETRWYGLEIMSVKKELRGALMHTFSAH